MLLSSYLSFFKFKTNKQTNKQTNKKIFLVKLLLDKDLPTQKVQKQLLNPFALW